MERLSENLQQLSVYNSGYINNFTNYPWIVYTDSDIELNPKTPLEFIEKVVYLTEKYGKLKGGLSLDLGNLPDNEYANHYREWESKYWELPLEPDVYQADLDTTFCVIKPGTPFQYDALRVAGDLTAKHVPWHTDFSDLSEEELYYLESSLEWSSYKRFYRNFIKTK